MTSPGPAFQECTGSCHVNVPAPKAVSSQAAINRWSDFIGQDRDNHHLGTLSTILQHLTHNETQWPTATRRCRFALHDVSCRQSWHLSTPSHLRVPPEWPTVGKPSTDAGSLCSEKHSRPPELKSSSNVSLPFAWITGPRKQTQLQVLQQ